MPDAAAQYALFVSCVAGQPVTRYGTRTFIGAERRAKEPQVIDYDPTVVVAISHDEFRRYRKEYLRALNSGSLVTRDAADWHRQNRQGSTDEKTGSGTTPAPAKSSTGE